MIDAEITAPDFLKSKKIWLLWRYEQTATKPLKIPLYAHGGRRSGAQGSPDDVQKLVDFETAKRQALLKSGFGLGFALLEKENLAVIDYDACVVDGVILPDVQKIAALSYAEFSPSKTGVHVIFSGDLTNQKFLNQEIKTEFFSTSGFVTFTADVIPDCYLVGNESTINPAPEFLKPNSSKVELVELVEQKAGLAPAVIDQCLTALSADCTYDEWIKIGMALHFESGGLDFDRWDEWSSKSEKYSGFENTLKKWGSFGRRKSSLVTGQTLIKLANQAGACIVDARNAEGFDDLDLPAGIKKSQLAIIQASEFAVLQKTEWLVKDLVPSADLVLIYGASGSGKSFFVLDLALSVSRGCTFFGLKTKKHAVLYVCAEGAGGFRKRLLAWQLHNDISLADIDLYVLPAAPNLVNRESVARLADDMKSSGVEFGLIVIDTFAQTTAGSNENTGEDVGKALAHCKALKKTTGATVLLVHHSGKDSGKGPRGWSGIPAACDAMLEISKTENGRCAKTTKQKDGRDDITLSFELKIIDLGLDEDFDKITSCVSVQNFEEI
jgi:KaiC/GvpD/RAD55 family RecA-like ATPase